MNFTIYTPLDTKKAIAFTNSLPKHIRLGVRLGLNQSGKELQAYTKEQMIKGQKTGRIYKVYTGLGGRKLSNPKFMSQSSLSSKILFNSRSISGSLLYK